MDLKVKVLINGKNHNLQFNQLTINQKIFKFTDLIVELGFDAYKSADIIDMVHSQWIGELMEIEIYDSVNTKIKKKYSGIITTLDTSVNQIFVEAKSNDFLLSSGKKYKSWLETEGVGIVKDILDNAGVDNSKFTVNNSLKYNFFQQYDETDYECLLRLALIDGCVFFHDGESFLYLDKLTDNKNVELGLEEVINFSLHSELIKTKWVGAPYNYLKHTEPSDSKISSSKIQPTSHEFADKLYDKSNKVFEKQVDNLYNQTIVTKNLFENFLKNQQKSEVGEQIQFSAELNNPMAFIGTTIVSSTHPILKNKMFITEITATFEDNVYTANVKGVAPNSIIFPPIDDNKLFKHLIEPARVIDNIDKEELGRVQIQYLWDTDGRAQTWARTIEFGAGMTKNGISYGAHFTPRIGDHVVVAAENGDPSKPIIIGSVYHSEKKPNFISKNGTEEVLIIKTPQESEIRINDKPGKEEILIQTKNSKNIIKLTLKEPKIFIEAVGGEIEVHSKNIKITADKELNISAENITIKASKNINSEVGQNISTKSGKNNTTESGGNINVKASQNIEMTAGQNLTSKAGMNAEISASAQVKVSGTQVESSAAATNTIKGAMVMIN